MDSRKDNLSTSGSDLNNQKKFVFKIKRTLSIFLTALTFSALSQMPDSMESPTNSLEDIYRKSHPTLAYSYDPVAQIHNYSNNWDFDNDGINDELYFVSTGGAHLYYYLKVVLSTDKESREFRFIESDYPILVTTDTLNIDKLVLGFIVSDVGKNATPSIIVRLDDSTFHASKKELNKRKIKTKNVVISFENRRTQFNSL
jgi:hypothetical protein